MDGLKKICFDVQVEGQQLHFPYSLTIVEGTQEFIAFRFNLSDEWKSLMSTAQFWQEDLDAPIDVLLDEDGCVDLPPELKAGSFTVMLYGGSGTVVAKSESLCLYLNRCELKDGKSVTALTPSLYAQFVDLIKEYRKGIIEDGSIEYEKLSSDAVTALKENIRPIPVINQTESSVTISPNVFNVWGEILELNITLATPTDNSIYNEYFFQFKSGATATTLTLPDTVKWVSSPTIEINKTYQCSIVNNIGVLVGA